MINFQPFTQSDWWGLSGAENFVDGSTPLISTAPITLVNAAKPLGEVGQFSIGTYCCVIDRNGVEFQLCDERQLSGGKDHCVALSARVFKPYTGSEQFPSATVALGLLQMVIDFDRPVSLVALKAMGAIEL